MTNLTHIIARLKNKIHTWHEGSQHKQDIEKLIEVVEETDDPLLKPTIIHLNREDHPAGTSLVVVITFPSLNGPHQNILNQIPVVIKEWPKNDWSVLLTREDGLSFYEDTHITSQWFHKADVTVLSVGSKLTNITPIHPNPLDHPVGTILLIENSADVWGDDGSVRVTVSDWGKSDPDKFIRDKILLVRQNLDGTHGLKCFSGFWRPKNEVSIKRVVGMTTEPLILGDVVIPPVIHPNKENHPVGTVMVITGKINKNSIEETTVTVGDWIGEGNYSQVLLIKKDGGRLNSWNLRKSEIPADRLWFFSNEVNVIENLGITQKEETEIVGPEKVIINPIDHSVGSMLIIEARYMGKEILNPEVVVRSWHQRCDGVLEVILETIDGSSIVSSPETIRSLRFISNDVIVKERITKQQLKTEENLPEEKINDDFMYHLTELRRLADKLGGKVTITF